MKDHQLQWRVNPGGPWKYHSRVESQEGGAQALTYNSRPIRSFDYRVVANDSPDALTPAPANASAGRMEQQPGNFFGMGMPR